METNIIYNEKCETGLLRLPAKCVQCCVTSPPFFGSGTTGEVALRLERNYIGFEISPEFIAIADKRLSTHKHNLFSI